VKHCLLGLRDAAKTALDKGEATSNTSKPPKPAEFSSSCEAMGLYRFLMSNKIRPARQKQFAEAFRDLVFLHKPVTHNINTDDYDADQYNADSEPED
ncbi:hypothetical protein HK102_003336, partial [Quaeritorhiza haematococci]